MRTSETCEAILPAVFELQQSVKRIRNTETASDGEDFWTYAPLPQVLDKLRPALKRHRIAVFQDTRGDGPTAGAMTRLAHVESGEWIESEWLMLPGRTQSDALAGVTLARRYSLLGLLGLATYDAGGGRQQTPGADVTHAQPTAAARQQGAARAPRGPSAPTSAGAPRWMRDKVRKRLRQLKLEHMTEALCREASDGRTVVLEELTETEITALIADLDDRWEKRPRA